MSGGTLVTLRGNRFQTTTVVTIGGVQALPVTFISSSEIRVNTPAHSAGAVDVKVSNSDGDSATRTNAFTYEALAITSLSATSGPSTGGTGVTVFGKLFQPGATVKFGGTLSAVVTFKSSTELQATTPAHIPGIVNVDVRNPDNQSDTLSGGFTYSDVLRVDSVSPANGPPAGGTTITITGAAFLAGATVQIGGVAATSVNVINGTTISAITPSGSGNVSLAVINPGGATASLSGGFTYDPPKQIVADPVISGVSPSAGGQTGGTAVLITGTNFQSGATVAFGGAAATQVSVVSGGQIAAVTPPHTSGPVNVTVTNPDGKFDTATGAYTYTGLTATGVSPNVGSTAGGTIVTVTGSEFQSSTKVFFGGISATSVTLLSSLQLRVTAPAHIAGIVDIEVRNTDGQS
ncbi:MAG: IPT/TIG domain-containing protein, partial [Terriglobales bacterium]